jgi:hypothetical protein
MPPNAAQTPRNNLLKLPEKVNNSPDRVLSNYAGL